MREPFAWCHLHPYPGVALARVPPIVPYAGFDDGRLALMQTGVGWTILNTEAINSAIFVR
jgi:hypothetical protein